MTHSATAIFFKPKRFGDNRGWFSETFREDWLPDLGIGCRFVQDNLSSSVRVGTVRGIHFQTAPHAQAKLVRCAKGRIIDYVVDLRAGSPTFGHHVFAELTADGGEQLFVPAGCGHAFVTLEGDTEVAYKVSDYYAPACDGGVRWDCPTIGIDWPLPEGGATVSAKDAGLPELTALGAVFDYDGTPLQLLQR